MRQKLNFASDAKTWYDRASTATQLDAEPVLTFLSPAFSITWFRERGHRIWMAIIKPSEKVAEHFALSMEYVLIGHGFPTDFQQRTLLADPPAELQYRVDSRIRFVASAAPLMRATCAAWAAQKKIAIIPVDAQSLNLEGALQHTYDILTNSLWRRDVFDDSEPITDAAEFFGRQQAVQELATKAFLGQPTAVFGLRKIGKSSLLRRVQGLLDVDAGHLVATTLLLCNSTRLKAGRWWTVLVELLNGWSRTLELRAAALGSPVRPRVAKLAELITEGRRLGDPSAVAEAFEYDFSRLVRAAKQIQRDKGLGDLRLVAVFDEVDHFYPHLPDSGYWAEDYFFLWNTLQALKRGLSDPAEVVYTIGGVNPAGVEAGSLRGKPNPLFEMSRLFLGPLLLKESRELLMGLGSRVGFVFDDGAIDRCYEITGGHPWLLRKLGSKIHKAYSDRSERMLVTAGQVTRTFQRTKRDFYAHIDWILNHLRDVAPDEFRLLRDISVGGRDKYLSDWSDQGFRDTFADHLFEYGLVRFTDDRPEVALGLVRDALTLPAASSLSEQKKQLREAIDLFESTIRSRLRTDLGAALGLGAVVDAIVEAVPKEATNRSLGREQLRGVGENGGLQALVENLNWSDYLILLDKFHSQIRWSGQPIDADERMARIKEVVKFLHLVRHNNDSELHKIILDRGFDTVYRELTMVHEMVAG